MKMLGKIEIEGFSFNRKIDWLNSFCLITGLLFLKIILKNVMILNIANKQANLKTFQSQNSCFNTVQNPEIIDMIKNLQLF